MSFTAEIALVSVALIILFFPYSLRWFEIYSFRCCVVFFCDRGVVTFRIFIGIDEFRCFLHFASALFRYVLRFVKEPFFLLLLLFVFGSVWLVRKQRKVREKMESWILEKAKFVFGIVGVF